MSFTVKGPKVYLVGRQEIDDTALDAFLADHDVPQWETDTEVAGQKLAEVAGRLCYLSFAKPRPGGNAAYLGHILEVGHGSVLEHSVFNLVLTGVSRSFTHELVRHRAGFGFSQLSQRFVDEGGDAGKPLEVVEPPLVRECREFIGTYMSQYGMSAESLDPSAPGEFPREAELAAVVVRNFDKAMEEAAGHYRALDGALTELFGIWYPGMERTAKRKQAREASRSVLPNATETKIFVTANARALRHFVAMRAHPAADAEIREVALIVLGLLQKEALNLFGDFEVHDGAATTPYPKV